MLAVQDPSDGTAERLAGERRDGREDDRNRCACQDGQDEEDHTQAGCLSVAGSA